jgi:hypothetical protein
LCYSFPSLPSFGGGFCPQVDHCLQIQIAVDRFPEIEKNGWKKMLI